MLIGNNWEIEANSLNVILFRLSKSKRGKETKKVEGYYSSVASTLKALVDFQVRDSHLKDLRIVVATIEKTKTDILDALKKTPTSDVGQGKA